MYKQIIVLTLLALATVSYAQVTGWVDCGKSCLIFDYCFFSGKVMQILFKKNVNKQEAPQGSVHLEPVHAPKHRAHLFVAIPMTLFLMLQQVRFSFDRFVVWRKLIILFNQYSRICQQSSIRRKRNHSWSTMDDYARKCLRSIELPNPTGSRLLLQLRIQRESSFSTGIDNIFFSFLFCGAWQHDFWTFTGTNNRHHSCSKPS